MEFLNVFIYKNEMIVVRSYKDYSSAKEDECLNLNYEKVCNLDPKQYSVFEMIDVVNQLIYDNNTKVFKLFICEFSDGYSPSEELSKVARNIIEHHFNVGDYSKHYLDEETDQKEFLEKMKEQYSFIDTITFNEEYENGHHTHICWLNFPYVSKASDTAFFHFSSVEEFNEWIDTSHIMTKEECLGDNSSIYYDNYSRFTTTEEGISNEEMWAIVEREYLNVGGVSKTDNKIIDLGDMGHFEVCDIEETNVSKRALNVCLKGKEDANEDFELQISHLENDMRFNFSVERFTYNKTGEIVDGTWTDLHKVFNENDIPFITNMLIEIFVDHYKTDYTKEDAKKFLVDTLENDHHNTVIEDYINWLCKYEGEYVYKCKDTKDNTMFLVQGLGIVYNYTEFVDYMLKDESWLEEIIKTQLVRA